MQKGIQATNAQVPPSLSEFVEKPVSHQLVELRPGMKNLDMKVIILTRDAPKELKNKELLV